MQLPSRTTPSLGNKRISDRIGGYEAIEPGILDKFKATVSVLEAVIFRGPFEKLEA